MNTNMEILKPISICSSKPMPIPNKKKTNSLIPIPKKEKTISQIPIQSFSFLTKLL